jgi:hypothetical protein
MLLKNEDYIHARICWQITVISTLEQLDYFKIKGLEPIIFRHQISSTINRGIVGMDRLVLILDFHAEEITYFKVQIIYTVIRQIVLPCGQAGVHDTFFFWLKGATRPPISLKKLESVIQQNKNGYSSRNLCYSTHHYHTGNLKPEQKD